MAFAVNIHPDQSIKLTVAEPVTLSITNIALAPSSNV